MRVFVLSSVITGAGQYECVGSTSKTLKNMTRAETVGLLIDKLAKQDV